MQQHNKNPQLERLPQKVREFWEKKQRDTGEILLLFSYATMFESLERESAKKNGLLYLMESHLWFEDFQRPPALFFSQNATYEKTVIQIPRECIHSARIVNPATSSKRGIIGKFFSMFAPNPVFLHISGVYAAGEEFSYFFRDVINHKSWEQAFLSKA